MHRSHYLTYSKAFLIHLLAIVLLLAGCGELSPSLSAESPSPSAEREGDSAMTYQLTEQLLAEPETAFEATEENLVLSLADCFSANGNLYYLYTVFRMQDELPIFHGSCLFVLESPDTQWKYYTLALESWNSDTYYIAQNIVSVSEDGVLFALQELSGVNSSADCLGFYSWDKNCEFLGKLDSSISSADLYFLEENLYTITGSTLTSYDPQFQPIQTLNLQNRISGCLTSGSDSLWYGFDADQNLAVWDEPTGELLYLLGDMVTPYSDFCLTRTASGEFILADTSGLWAGDGSAPLEKILSFADRDYALEEILGMGCHEDGKLFLFVRFDNSLYLLTAEPCKISELPVKQEITLVAYNTSTLEKVAVAFNRQNEQYRVTLIDVSSQSNRSEYLQSLQLEFSSGRGPDLVSPFVIDCENAAKNGYLEPLEDIIEDPAEYWDACLETGKIDGVTYGVPYRIYLSLLTASQTLVGDREAWTLEQMMETIRNSPAEALEMGKDGIDLVLQYGLMTPDNPQFIDYEAGVSHLTEPSFLSFLEFAEDYSDQLTYTADRSNAAEYYQNGLLAAYYLTVNNPGDLLFPISCYENEEVLVGLPHSQGRGVYMGAELLYLNSSSSCKEGAKEFLRYLLSAEGQLCYVKNYNNYSALSCRRDITETVLQMYQTINDKTHPDIHSYLGVTYEVVPLDEEQISQFWSLFEDAEPEWRWPSGLAAIINEELAPYFAGDCSSAEAAEKLDSRIQLYLNEKQ
ncbi:MAG: extracellular solute-binding protein [Lachnospiraceae bacterium]|nr:extracellular solute-binding protein [Lachnospiraceae bacterium]